MYSFLAPLIATFLSSVAFADMPELWVAQTRSCVSGSVNLDVGAAQLKMTSGPGVGFLAHTRNGHLIETENEAILILPTDGSANSECMNENKPTLFILTIAK